MTDFKTCQQCGVRFERPANTSNPHWARRQFCGKPCQWASMVQPEPSKHCEVCGVSIHRSRCPGGQAESLSGFNRRRTCGYSCSYRLPRPPAKGSYRLAVGSCCESCGWTVNLQVHHVNGDHGDNDPGNLQTLCQVCHGYWHGLHKRLGIRVSSRMPAVLVAEPLSAALMNTPCVR